MPRRYEDAIESLDYGELTRLKQDVDEGAFKTKKILEERIKTKLKEHEKTCSTCSNDLKFYSTSNYTLVFGPDDFKKKASFCGIDCMEYFIIKLKEIKTKKEDISKDALQRS